MRMEEKESGQPISGEGAPADTENPAPLQSESTEAEEPVTAEKTAEPTATPNDEEELEATDGEEFAARYQSAKERDIEKLSQEMEDRSSNNTKKKKWKTALKTILMIALIGLSVGIMFGLGDYLGGDQLGFVEMLKNSFSWKYFLVFLAAIIAYIFFESLKYAYLLKISTGKWRLKNSVKVMFLGKYYDGIKIGRASCRERVS